MPLRPYLSIIYNTSNLDISGFIRSFVLDISITQRLTDAATNVAVKIRDDEMKFQNDPTFNGIGDTLDVELFYENATPDKKLDAGVFYLDRVELSAPPDVLALRALNYPLNQALRTKKTRTWSSTTLSGIVSAIATEHGLSVSGTREPVNFTNWEQSDKSDLEFLMDLAQDFDHVFRFDSLGRLYFHSWELLDNAANSWSFNKDDLLARPSLRFTSADSGTYRNFTTNYDDGSPGTANLIDTFVYSTDSITGSTTYESFAQAQLGVRGLWRRTNSLRRSVEFTIEGDGRVNLGQNFAIAGYGTFDGNYQIQELRNSLSNNGWVTEIKGRKLYEEFPS
ncbi:MAG: hypothetical protein F6K31_03225 [Symploca sp. SIO2G7]|nr:hypothetical protein [Symploca sp. SIO2G7]